MRRQQTNQLSVFETSRAGLVKVKALMFFASILLQTPMIEDPTCATAWTNMVVIGYNPAFIESLDVPTAKFVIIHEIMHIILKHGLRLGGRDPAEWNRCCDYAINIILKDLGFKVWQWALIDDRYRGMTAEQIYLTRQQEREKEREQSKGKGKQKGGKGEGQGRPQPGSSPEPPPEQTQGGLGGDLKPVPAATPEKRAAIEHEINKTLARATAIAREHGVMPGILEAIITATYADPVPWDQVLVDYMSACLKTEENWRRRNRRYSDVILPSYESDGMDELTIVADSSGSMFNKKIFERIAVAVNHIVWADDSEMSNIDVFEEGNEVVLHPRGGGGTDMRKPLTYVQENYSPEVVLLLTDGFTPWPDVATPFPLIVGCTTNAPCPDWAATIRIEVA
jgi:predicted metal-dependent peptidase